MKKIAMIVCIFVLFLFVGCQSRIVGNDVTGEVVSSVDYGAPDYGIEKQKRQGNEFVTVKEFHIIAEDQYRPNYLVVNQGDVVRLVIYASTHNNGIVIPEYGINEFLEEDNYKTIEFIADISGTFGFYSNIYIGPETEYMNGKLVVEEAEE